jgi:creatinine amidohydrolase
VDTIQVTEIARRVDEKLSSSVLMLPTLWVGSSHHHKDYPGTISLIPSLYSAVIQGIASCVLGAGYKRILFLNGHGGNETPLAQALSELSMTSDAADDAYLVSGSWWSMSGTALDPRKHNLQTPNLAPPNVSHACEVETSLILALRPDLVARLRPDQKQQVLQSPYFNFEYGGPVGVYRRWHRVTPTGVMGSPSLGTADKGRSIIAAVVDEVVKFVEDFAAWPPLPKIGPKAKV